MCAHQEATCPTGSIVNADIRIPDRRKRKPPPIGPSEKILSGPALLPCPAPTLCRAARSAARFYPRGSKPTASVRNAERRCTPAGTALTLKRQPASSVRSQFLNGSQRRMRPIGAPSFPCGFASKRKPRLRLRRRPSQLLRTPAAPSKISSRSSYGFCVGRNRISLANDCGACVTSIATAWATSSGCNIFAGSFPACGLSSVFTDPGQTTATRMP